MQIMLYIIYLVYCDISLHICPIYRAFLSYYHLYMYVTAVSHRYLLVIGA